MSNAGWATLDVIPSVKNLRAQLEQQTSRDFAAAGRRGGEQFGDAAGKAAGGRFKSKFGSVAKDAFAPVAGIVAGAAIVDLFKDAVSGASDLAESGNKVKVIFGDATGEVQKFAAQGAKALGQTQLQVLDAASSFGTFGKAAGLSGSDLADFSTKLAGLSTDMASFFNTSPDQAVEAIGAALRGEAEPIRAFGVLLDDATLRQEALRQGLIATTKQALTPQQKVLAAYAVILKQTKDAQGDFARTSDGLANQQRILSAQWAEMKTELGSKLLPAVTAITRSFNDGVLPAMEGAGGAVADSVRAFNSLPAPVKAATGALVAFRAAQALGVTSAGSRGLASLSSGLESLRLRAMLAADQYRSLRTATLETTASAHVFSPEVGRMAASLGALRTAGMGAGAGLKRGLSGAMSLIGGPWGIALAAGTFAVAHFWQEHQKAKQRVEDFTATLDKETGALTESSREFAAKQLLDAGVLAGAQRLGVSLELVTNAALNQKGAMAALTSEIASRGQLDTQAAEDAIKLKAAIDDQNGVVQQSITKQKLFGEAVGGTSAESKKAAAAAQAYASRLGDARTEVQKLLDVENKRRNANLGVLGDRIALNQALDDARKEAGEGARTLDLNAQAGRDNASALRDLADAWNNSADKVKNTKGAYDKIRQQFIDIAVSMGDSKGEAKKLADSLLGIPKKTPAEITTPGMKKALADLAELRAELKAIHNFKGARVVISAQATKNQATLSDLPGHATGGLIGGRGSGTSDSNLIWASRGEFMQRKAAVDYYGEDFMRRLNNLQIPKFAGGGPIGETTTTTTLGQEIRGTLAIDRDGIAYIRGVARDAVTAGAAAAQANARMAAMDNIRRPR